MNNDLTDEAEAAFRIERAPAEKLSDYELEQQTIRAKYERLKALRKSREAE